ncbi:Ras family protein, partial [Ancylostoma ceylanicum]
RSPFIYRFHSDTAGQQEYSIFPRSCSVDIDGFILVYAIDDKKSFEIIQIIHDKIMETIGDDKVPIVIVGNKVDLQHASRVVTKEDGAKLAQKWKAAFIETSAKDNTVWSFYLISTSLLKIHGFHGFSRFCTNME